MEDLALIVSLMLLSEIVFGLAVLGFNIAYRVRGKFEKTTLILLGVLAIEAIWAVSLLPAFGYPSLALLAVSALLRFIPRRAKR